MSFLKCLPGSLYRLIYVRSLLVKNFHKTCLKWFKNLSEAFRLSGVVGGEGREGWREGGREGGGNNYALMSSYDNTIHIL